MIHARGLVQTFQTGQGRTKAEGSVDDGATSPVLPVTPGTATGTPSAGPTPSPTTTEGALR